MSELDRDHNQIVDMFHVSSDEPFSDIGVHIVDNQIPRGSTANFGANKRWKIKLTVIP